MSFGEEYRGASAGRIAFGLRVDVFIRQALSAQVKQLRLDSILGEKETLTNLTPKSRSTSIFRAVENELRKEASSVREKLTDEDSYPLYLSLLEGAASFIHEASNNSCAYSQHRLLCRLNGEESLQPKALREFDI